VPWYQAQSLQIWADFVSGKQRGEVAKFVENQLETLKNPRLSHQGRITYSHQTGSSEKSSTQKVPLITGY